MRMKRIYIILLLCLTFDVFANVFSGDLAYDDYYFIRDNPGVHTLSNFGTFFTDISRTSSQELQFDVYRPLTTISFALTHALFGLDPLPYHLINIILHALNTILVFYLCRLLFIPRASPDVCRDESRGIDGSRLRPVKNSAGLRSNNNTVMAFFVAAIFAVHPAQTEAVAWISGRGNVQSLFFMLVAMLLYIKYDEIRNPKSEIRNKSEAQNPKFETNVKHETFRIFIVYLASLLFYALSVFSKEAGIVLPALILAWYAFVPCDNRWGTLRRHLLRLTPFFAAALAFVLLRIHFLGQLGQVPPHGGSLFTHGLVAIQTTAAYLKMALAPVVLTVMHTAPPLKVLYGPWTGIALSAIILAVWFPLRLRRRSYLYPMGMAWFFIALAPMMNIVPIRTFVNERFLYASIIGFAFVLVQGVFDISLLLKRVLPNSLPLCTCPPVVWRKGEPEGVDLGREVCSPLVIMFLIVVLCLYSVRTVIRNRDWAGPIPLWESVARVDPASSAAMYNLGVEHDHRGRDDLAMKYYLEAMRGHGGDSMFAMINLAQMLRERGEIEKAMVINDETMRLYPERSPAYVNQAWILMTNLKDYRRAEPLLARALELDPNSYYVHEALVRLYEDTDRPELAAKHKERTSQLSPAFGVTGQ